MRRAWCRQALLALLRRWGVYAVVVIALVSAGTTGGLQIAAALAAASVLPLFHAVVQSAPAALLTGLLQAAAGAGVIWALRPLLLPRRWLEAERALPIAARERHLSDTTLVLLALLPLFVLYAGGAASVLGSAPTWLQPRRGAAVAALLATGFGSLLLGVFLLQLRRRAPRHRFSPHSAAAARSGARHWPLVLLVLPLWRGPARRLGAVLAASTLLLALPVAGLLLWPQGGGWWLAALGAAGLLLASRAATLVHEELLPLLAEATVLPLPPRRLRRSAMLLPLLPLLPSHTGLALALPWPSVRPGVWALFVLASLGSAWLQSSSQPVDAETRSGRWLLFLALLLALASEVLQ